MFYIKSNTSAGTKLSLVKSNLLNYLDMIANNTNTDPSKLYFTGVIDRNKQLATPIQIDSRPQQKPVRDFIDLNFAYQDRSEIDTFKSHICNFISYAGSPDYYAYIDPDDTSYHVIILLNEMLGISDYRKLIKEIANTDELAPIKSHLIKPKSGFAPINLPNYHSNLGSQYSISQISSNHVTTLQVSNFIDGSNGVLQPNTVNQYDIHKLQKALDEYLGEHDIKELVTHDTSLRDLTDSVSSSLLRDLINKDFVILVAKSLMKKVPTETEHIKDAFKESYLELLNSPASQKSVTPLCDYFPLYRQTSTHNKTLAQQLIDALPPDFLPDPELPLSEAGDLIKNIYAPALIDRPGEERDNVAIFNPLTGVWEHEDDSFANLIAEVRPYTSKQQVETVIRNFAADAFNRNRLFKPYAGSRYLLFKNGVLDITNLKFHDLDEDLVRDLHFTQRSRLNIDYMENPPLPKLPSERSFDGGDWNPQDFITAYANNDPDKLDYLLFGLSLGLFGGHNFGVHFSIKGTSRWGKTSLLEIYNGLYNNHTILLPFKSLNTQFAFSSYSPDTSIIWINECNEEAPALNDEQGTMLYDGLADNQVRFNVKHAGDMVVENPPQVYVDGTSLVKADDMSTGPSGRTLAYCLPDMTDDLRNQAYAINIANDLRDKQVLQWLVWQMIVAYRKFVPEARLGNFRMNLSLKSDLNLLPSFAISWRNNLNSSDIALSSWFKDEVEPYLKQTTDPSKGTIMHNQVLYTLYEQYYQNINPHDHYFSKMMQFDTFQQRIIKVLKNNDWGIKYTNNDPSYRHRYSSLGSLRFDWASRDRDFDKPRAYQDPTDLPAPFNNKCRGWYTLYKI